MAFSVIVTDVFVTKEATAAPVGIPLPNKYEPRTISLVSATEVMTAEPDEVLPVNVCMTADYWNVTVNEESGNLAVSPLFTVREVLTGP